MHHGVEAPGGEDGVEAFTVADVRLHASNVAVGDDAQRLQNAGRRVREIVEERRFVSGAKQLDGRVAADVAGAAGDQHLHAGLPACFPAA